MTVIINILHNGDYRAQIVQPATMTREGPFHWKVASVPSALMALIQEKLDSGAPGPYCFPLETTLKELYAATLVH